MSMTRPLLLIDVDGPLNPYGARHMPEGYTDHSIAPPSWLVGVSAAGQVLSNGGALSVWLDHTHGAALQALPYDLVWCTTWGDDANAFIGPEIGLPELPVLPLGNAAPRQDHTFWKTWPVIKYCAGRPFAWIDDEIGEVDIRCVKEKHDAPALLLPVSPWTGLTDTDFTMLRAWAEGLQ